MDTRTQLGLWVAASLAIGLVALVVHRSRDETYWQDNNAGGVLADIALFIYHIGLPFLALIAGALSLDLIGLGTDWFRADHVAGFALDEWLGGVGIALASTLFVVVVVWLNRHTLVPSRSEQGLALWRNAIYDEVHWALYRSVFVLLFGAFYGAVAGVGLVVAEWLLRSIVARHTIRASERMVPALCLVTSAFLFVATQNLWLMLAVDIALRLFARRVAMFLAPSALGIR